MIATLEDFKDQINIIFTRNQPLYQILHILNQLMIIILFMEMEAFFSLLVHQIYNLFFKLIGILGINLMLVHLQALVIVIIIWEQLQYRKEQLHLPLEKYVFGIIQILIMLFYYKLQILQAKINKVTRLMIVLLVLMVNYYMFYSKV